MPTFVDYCFSLNHLNIIGGISSHSALSASFGFTDAAWIAVTIAAITAANARDPIAHAESGSAAPVSKSKLVMMRALSSAVPTPTASPRPVN
jgi:hypothetical protein